MSQEFHYVGGELDLFSAATNWKDYLRRQISPYLGPRVLEVGAGFGGTTRFLCRGNHEEWVCLEPDPALADRLAAATASGTLPACCQAKVGTLADLPLAVEFDTVLYIDVLEHIEDDAAELARAAARLRPGGHLVALAPAHPWLFTPFDAAIGHHRRYTRRTLAALAGPNLERVRLRYLDSVGLLASLGNRLILSQSMPTPAQISVWDRLMVPLSRIVDRLVLYRLGKSVLAVWRIRPAGTDPDASGNRPR